MEEKKGDKRRTKSKKWSLVAVGALLAATQMHGPNPPDISRIEAELLAPSTSKQLSISHSGKQLQGGETKFATEYVLYYNYYAYSDYYNYYNYGDSN
ncbi:MAG: hypothetical protein AB9866_20000 [Syntrophobacteraceae bacterium]